MLLLVGQMSHIAKPRSSDMHGHFSVCFSDFACEVACEWQVGKKMR